MYRSPPMWYPRAKLHPCWTGRDVKLLARSPLNPKARFSPPALFHLELTKSICLCESAEKYLAFIRVKGHGIGQCQSAEVFRRLGVCTAPTERRSRFQFPFTRQADLHQRRAWPVAYMATAVKQGSFHQRWTRTNMQMATTSAHCDAAAASSLEKSKENSTFFSSRAKWGSLPPPLLPPPLPSWLEQVDP